jgi:hypothetical protein
MGPRLDFWVLIDIILVSTHPIPLTGWFQADFEQPNVDVEPDGYKWVDAAWTIAQTGDHEGKLRPLHFPAQSSCGFCYILSYPQMFSSNLLIPHRSLQRHHSLKHTPLHLLRLLRHEPIRGDNTLPLQCQPRRSKRHASKHHPLLDICLQPLDHKYRCHPEPLRQCLFFLVTA